MSLWTVKDLAQFCGLHQNTIYKLIRKGEIPAIKRGRLIRFRKDEIDAWLNDHSSKVFPLLEPLTQIDLQLDNYDRLFLKGGVKVNPKGKTWNYPFGSVYLRQSKSGKERWYIYYRFEGRRIRKAVKGALSRADALKVLQVEVADAFRGKHGFKKQEKKLSFAEFASEYLESYAKPNKKSWRDDLCCVEILNGYFGNIFLDEITPQEVERLKADRLKKGNSPARVNRYLALLKKMFNLAIDWGYAKENPIRKIKFFPEDNLKERILSPQEECRLLECSAEHLRPIVIAALHTGMRRAEILNLRWAQVDLKKRTISVERTKSGKTRVIPINEVILGVLEAQKQKNLSSPYVFLAPRSQRPLKDVKTAFNAAVRRAGIKGLRFHDLRHTFASRLIEQGVDLITVKELLGHYSVTITQRYTHSRSELKQRAVESLAKPLSPAPAFVPNLSTRPEGRLLNALFTAN
jgi:excisionase family DNA binding protein